MWESTDRYIVLQVEGVGVQHLLEPLFWGKNRFYVTDGNIMYLTDASRFLISCVIQHNAPVVGWGRVEEQMHNVDFDPGP